MCGALVGQNVTSDRVPISVVIGTVVILMVVKEAVIGDARWGNLVMAGWLMAVLVVYLIREHQRRD